MASTSDTTKNPKYDPEFGTVVGKRPFGAGRPKVFTPEKKRLFLSLLEKGNYRKDALALLKINHQTFATEVRRDPSFKAAVRAAEEKSVADAIECFSKAAKKDWKASMEYLARKRPEKWAKQTQIKIDPTSTSGSKKNREVVEALLAKLVEDGSDTSSPMTSLEPADASSTSPPPAPPPVPKEPTCSFCGLAMPTSTTKRMCSAQKNAWCADDR